MTPEQTGQRKSKRTGAVAWKEGDTRALFQAPGRRAPKEVAAAKEKAAEERKLKDQAIKKKEKKTARDIRHAAELEDSLAKEREKLEHSFPRRLSGMFIRLLNTKRNKPYVATIADVEKKDDSEPDKGGPTQKVPKQTAVQTDARRQAQPNHRQFVVEIVTPVKPVRGDTTSKGKYPPTSRVLLMFLTHRFSSRSAIETLPCGHGFGRRKRKTTKEI